MTSRTKEIFEHLTATGILNGYAARSSDEPIEWETAYALDEILASISKVENHLLPALLDTTAKDVAISLLEEIREELRHAVYHVRDASFFSIVVDN